MNSVKGGLEVCILFSVISVLVRFPTTNLLKSFYFCNLLSTVDKTFNHVCLFHLPCPLSASTWVRFPISLISTPSPSLFNGSVNFCHRSKIPPTAFPSLSAFQRGTVPSVAHSSASFNHFLSHGIFPCNLLPIKFGVNYVVSALKKPKEDGQHTSLCLICSSDTEFQLPVSLNLHPTLTILFVVFNLLQKSLNKLEEQHVICVDTIQTLGFHIQFNNFNNFLLFL